MPYYADQRADLERQLHVLDPDLKLLDPENPGFPDFLARVTNLDANLAKNIDKAVVDEQAEAARELFGQASQKGNVVTVLSRGVNKAKGRSVRGDRRVRPVTFAAAAGGLLALAIGVTAWMPEKTEANAVDPSQNQTASAPAGTPAVAAEGVDPTPLPESTVDTAAVNEEAAPPITPMPSAATSEPAPAPEPAVPLVAAAPASITAPAPEPVMPVAYAPTPLADPVPLRAVPVTRAPEPDPLPLAAPLDTPPTARVTLPAPQPPAPATPPAALTSVAPPPAAQAASGKAQPSAVVSGIGKAAQVENTPPRAAVISAAPAQTQPQAQAAPPTALTASAIPAAAAPEPRTGLVASGAPTGASATPARGGLVPGQGAPSAPQAARAGVVSSAATQAPSDPQVSGLYSTSGSSGAPPTAVLGTPQGQAGTTPVGAGSASAEGGFMQASQAGAAESYLPGTVVAADLTTAVAVYPGATHPVWARAEDGSLWRGTAALDEKTGRVVLTFTVVMQGGRQLPVTAYAESADGPGLGGRVKQATPNAARAAVNGLLTGVRSFAESQAARTTTVTPTGVVSTAERPQNFWLAVGGALANAFVVPETRANVVPLGQIAAGERVFIRVDLPEKRS